MEKVEVIWNHNDSRARLWPRVAEKYVEAGRARYADESAADESAGEVLPPGYSILEPGGGWYQAIAPNEEQINGSKRSYEEAVALCVEHHKG